MGLLTVKASGQSLTVDILTTAGHEAATFTDEALSTPITLPLAITADQDFYFRSGEAVVNVTVTTEAGVVLLNAEQHVIGTVDHVVLTPLPSAAQEAATDSAPSGGSVSVDRLAVGVTPTVPSDLFTHAVDWTGATPDEQVGTSIAVSGANLHTTVDAVYAVTVRASFPTAAGNIRTLTVFDGNSVLPRFSTTVPPAAAGQSTIIETSFVYYLAGSPDTLTVWLTQDSGGDLAVDMYAAIQRLS